VAFSLDEDPVLIAERVARDAGGLIPTLLRFATGIGEGRQC
jgi:hypothetical protein